MSNIILCGYGCNKEAKFPPREGMNKWCCESHYNKCLFQIELKTKKALDSGKLFDRIPWNKNKKGLQKAWNRGKSLEECFEKEKVEKIKRKISKHKKNKTYEEIYGKKKAKEIKKKLKRYVKGKTYEERFGEEKSRKIKIEQKERMIGSNNPMFGRTGKNHPNWRGGCTKDGYCEEWKTRGLKDHILGRDDYRCQNLQCKNVSDKLCVHHINYNKKDCDPWNLITVCFSCNSMANFQREWWTSYYQEIIRRKKIYSCFK